MIDPAIKATVKADIKADVQSAKSAIAAEEAKATSTVVEFFKEVRPALYGALAGALIVLILIHL